MTVRSEPSLPFFITTGDVKTSSAPESIRISATKESSSAVISSILQESLTTLSVSSASFSAVPRNARTQFAVSKSLVPIP